MNRIKTKSQSFHVFMWITFILVSPTLSGAAGKSKPKLTPQPLDSKLISLEEFEEQLNRGTILPIPEQKPAKPAPLAPFSSLLSLLTLREDLEVRLPEHAPLLRLDLPASIQTPILLTSGQSRPITLMNTQFAARTLSQALQTRHSSFNNGLIQLQLSQAANAPTEDTAALSGPDPQQNLCTQELGYEHGYDLSPPGKPSPNGLWANFSWPLKPYTTCIKDQGKRGSCTAFATLSAIEAAAAKRHHLSLNLSEQALYNQSKLFWSPEYVPVLPSTADEQTDGFVTPEILTRAKMNAYLFPLESDWEYNASEKIKIDIPPLTPDQKIISHACDDYSGICSNTFHQGELVCAKKTRSYRCGYRSPTRASQRGVRLRDSTELWNHSDPRGSLALAASYLQAGEPLIASLAVTNRFLALKDGFADVSEANPDPSRPDLILGYHAITLIGYIPRTEILNKLPHAPLTPLQAPETDTLSGYFIIKNQWGSSWGDAGYAYLPGTYLAKNLLAVESIGDLDLTALPNRP